MKKENPKSGNRGSTRVWRPRNPEGEEREEGEI
jgi:hypothetical protein